jgi:rubrerythrin
MDLRPFQLTLSRKTKITDPHAFMKQVTEEGKKQFQDPKFQVFYMVYCCDYCGKHCSEDPNPFDCQTCQELHDHCHDCRGKNHCFR